jgi:hypothetical protein
VITPNPTGGLIRIALPSSAADLAGIELVDSTGHIVRRLSGNTQASGAGVLDWDVEGGGGARLRNGVYFVRARTSQGMWSKQILLLK